MLSASSAVSAFLLLLLLLLVLLASAAGASAAAAAAATALPGTYCRLVLLGVLFFILTLLLSAGRVRVHTCCEL